jgi:hypothetical protein
MSEDVPAALRPPVELALAKAVPAVPAEGALPGGCLYEPKWDGYRAAILVDAHGASLFSRQGKDLTRFSVGLMCPDADLWPSESAVVSAPQVSLTCLSMLIIQGSSLRFDSAPPPRLPAGCGSIRVRGHGLLALMKGKLCTLWERQDSLCRRHREPLAALLGRKNDDSFNCIERIAVQIRVASRAGLGH